MWLSVDLDGDEVIHSDLPKRGRSNCWECDQDGDNIIYAPKGTIKKLLGRELTWEDEPVEILNYE